MLARVVGDGRLFALNFRMGDVARGRSSLRLPNGSFLNMGGKFGAVVLKFLGAVMAAAAFAGALTVLSATTSAQHDASPPAMPEETSVKACADRPWPYLTCIGSSLENPHIQLLTTERLTPAAGNLRGPVSDIQILLENSQIQDW